MDLHYRAIIRTLRICVAVLYGLSGLKFKNTTLHTRSENVVKLANRNKLT